MLRLKKTVIDRLAHYVCTPGSIASSVVFLPTMILCLCCPSHLFAEVFYARDEALALAFPQVDAVEKKAFVLTDQQHAAAEKLARFKIDSKLFAFYEGIKDGVVVRYAAIDTQVVRTHPETFMVVLTPTGEVEKVVVLAFHEPGEYLPGERWLDQFEEATYSDELRPGRDIIGIFGSTLSATATAGGIRKVLALYKVLIQDASTQ